MIPTDNRMTAKNYGFEWAIRCHRDYLMMPYRLRDISAKHLGNYCLLPLSHYAFKNPRRYQFMVKFGEYNKNSNLYFRTREDAESVLTLYAIEYGTFE